MKTKHFIFCLLICSVNIPIFTQIYSPADSLALLNIDANCDLSNQLNWNTQDDPGSWDGVTWNGNSPKRVDQINVSSKMLSSILDATTLSAITQIWCNSNNLTGLSVNGLTNLRRIVFRNNQITGIDLTSCQSLEEIYCGNNDLELLDLSTVQNLKYLECEENKLDTLDISSLTNLIELYCQNNLLSQLKLADNTNLSILNCASNTLTSLDFSSLENIKEIYCQYNQFENLDVSALASLERLYLHGNLLSEFDPTGLVNITELSCHTNFLTSLDVTACSNLEQLYCGFNQLTNLNLTGLSKLITLYTNGNLLSTIDISTLTSLNSFTCYDNRIPFSVLKSYTDVPNLYYEPMDTIFSELTLGGTYLIDYSNEALVKDSITNFIFYHNSIPVDTNSTGLFTTGLPGIYSCKMENGNFPNLFINTAKITLTGEAPELTVSPLTINLDAISGSSGFFVITSNTAWTITGLEPWLSVSQTSGVLNDTIHVVALLNNNDTSARSLELTVNVNGAASQNVNIIQKGSAYFTISTTELNFGATKNVTSTVEINSNTDWSVSINQIWLTVDPASGSNNGIVTITADENLGASVRTAVVTISVTNLPSQTIAIMQAGKQSAITQRTFDARIYPNPVKDKVYLSFEQGTLPTHISLIDLDGKQLMQFDTDNNFYELDMSGYNSGIYIIRIMNFKQIAEYKIVKY